MNFKDFIAGWVVWAALTCLLCMGTRAIAQDMEGEAGQDVADAVVDRSEDSGEIEVQVEQFGLGNAAREADWTGVRLKLLDSGIKPRTVVVRLELNDPEGDKVQYQRVPVTQPGRWVGVWLYARLRARDVTFDSIPISVYEAVESGGGEGEADDEAAGGSARRYQTGRKLGTYMYRPAQVTPPYIAQTAVVGERSAGLEQYQDFRFSGARRDEAPPMGHELLDVVKGLRATELPDRWMGYAQFETLVWTSGDKERPAALSEPQGEAIREWVRRGGHLVVVMPAAGQSWIIGPGPGGQAHPLTQIMPTVRAQRLDGVDLNEYRSVLTRLPSVSLPESVTMYQFAATSQSDAYSAMPILTGSRGEIVAVRRLVGAGAVTLIGIDLTNPHFQKVEKSLQADLFWARVLGKRMRVDSASDLVRNLKASNNAYFQRTSSGKDLDGGVRDSIRLAAQTATGLLMAFVVFLAYWLLAGPVGHYVLKERGWKRHAWVGFVAATAIFTLIGWGGASLLKGRRVDVRHVTIVDHVFGQSNQRARAWLNIYVPKYGEVRTAVVSSKDAAGGAGDLSCNLLAPFDQPGAAGGSASFPDARGYVVDAKNPGYADFPSRATSKMVQVDWAGTLSQKWGMPQPMVEDGSQASLGSEIRIEQRADVLAGQRDWEIRGKLTHSLPGTLENVRVIVNLGLIDRPIPGSLFCNAYIANVREWPAGEVLDLSKLYSKSIGSANLNTGLNAEQLDLWLGRRSSLVVSDIVQMTRGEDVFQDLMDVAVMSMLPEQAERQRKESTTAVWLQRDITHMYDVSRWFTQPSVVILGVLNDARCPAPVTVDGLPLPTDSKRNVGTVLVRWMYPLAPAPPGSGRFNAATDPGAETLLERLEEQHLSEDEERAK